MTEHNIGSELLWAAKRGDSGHPDWAIYCWWKDETDLEVVVKTGEKITDRKHVERLLKFDDTAWRLYRF